MRTLYIECAMGAAGDMLSAALLELMPDREAALDILRHAKIPGVAFEAERSVKCGIVGTHLRVLVRGEEEGVHDHHTHEHDHVHHHHHHHHDHHEHHHHEHHHAAMRDIMHVLHHADIPAKVRADAEAAYRIIAEAESTVHGCPVDEVHFHEVGALDAIADVTAFSLLMHELAPQRVAVSPINTGSGHVKCAHGIIPVPAPATAHILRGVPSYSSGVQGELCTPTGAALLKHFASSFGPMPVMSVENIGYGMGTKDFDAANCVRAMIGESGEGCDEVCVLTFSVDDMTPEAIAFAIERILHAGALDAYTSPIGMKKSRPGTLVTVICSPDSKEEMIRLIFRHTTTIGLRESASGRRVLDRRIETIDTPAGSVRVKTSSGYGVVREKVEYEDVARIAREEGISFDEAVRRASRK